MTNVLIWSELLSTFILAPFLAGVLLGVFWSLRIRKMRGPPIKIMYETDIDSV
ncbi:MAG: hypothetical protein QQN63_10175 [Nitrosopumilus sp.]